MGTRSRLLIGSVNTTLRRALGVRRPHVLIACMPKSASTFVTDVLAEMPGMRRAHLSWTYGAREQVLDVVQMARFDLTAYVAQHHVRYSGHVAEAIAEYGLTPVVLTRNLFDVVASYRDHIRNESTESPIIPLGPEHAALPDAELEDLIADLIAPWYISFYVGWRNVEALHVTYDQVRTAPADVIGEICSRARIRVEASAVDRAIQAARTKSHRFNKGVAGRGQAISPQARARIASFARHFPDIDFSPIGIPRWESGPLKS